jgi:hypothetical protein
MGTHVFVLNRNDTADKSVVIACIFDCLLVLKRGFLLHLFAVYLGDIAPIR